MSTTPRVASAIPGAPADFRSGLAHVPAVAGAFHRLYGTMWSDGVVSQALKETARMRNARVTDCGFCKNVRFEGARSAGLDEGQVDLIRDGFEDSALSADQKLVLRWTDALLTDPGHVDPVLRAELGERFTPAEIVELSLAIAMFLGMSKVLISLGMEPEGMGTTVLPTPAPG